MALENQELRSEILSFMSPTDIAHAMQDFAEFMGDDTASFYCGDCRCGANSGQDYDSFACGDRANLDWIEWRGIK